MSEQTEKTRKIVTELRIENQRITKIVKTWTNQSRPSIYKDHATLQKVNFDRFCVDLVNVLKVPPY